MKGTKAELKMVKYYKLEDRKNQLARSLRLGAPDLLIDTQLRMVRQSMRQFYGWRFNRVWPLQMAWIRFTNWFRR